MGNKSGWIRWLPGLLTLRRYHVSWLAHDVVAGIVLAAILVPVGIAYAIASGVPGIYGLYATIIPLLTYALFGPSRILVLGPDSSLAAVILAIVLPLSGGDPSRAVTLASMMAIVSGTICILAGRGPRLRDRPSLQADPVWLYERNSTYGADQPGAEAFRFLDRERRAAEERVGDRGIGARWQDKLDRFRHRRGHADGNSSC